MGQAADREDCRPPPPGIVKHERVDTRQVQARDGQVEQADSEHRGGGREQEAIDRRQALGEVFHCAGRNRQHRDHQR